MSQYASKNTSHPETGWVRPGKHKQYQMIAKNSQTLNNLLNNLGQENWKDWLTGCVVGEEVRGHQPRSRDDLYYFLKGTQ